MSKKKICITGSSGFIFSNFIRNMLFNQNKSETKQYDFVGIDKITKSSTLNNIYNNKSYPFYLGDITDEHFIDVFFQIEKPDYIIHAAAETSVDHSLTHAVDFVKTNVVGTQVLLNAAIKYGVKRFIHISTDESMGHLENETDPSWTEESPMSPRNPYAASKASAELMVKTAAMAHGLDYCITRSSNNYGPRQTSNKLIPRVIKCILNNEKIPVYGEGKQIRDWLHVSDNCSAIMKVLENGRSGEIYNIGANQELSNIEVVQRICNAMEKGHNLIEHIEDPRGKAHDFRYSLNTGKIKKETGWEPQWKFKEGLLHTVGWYQNNKFFLK